MSLKSNSKIVRNVGMAAVRKVHNSHPEKRSKLLTKSLQQWNEESEGGDIS